MKKASFTVTSKAESNIEPIPAGLHASVLQALYDVGTQYDEHFDKARRLLIFLFVFPTLPPIEVERDGKKVALPRMCTLRLTKSLHEKAGLRKMLESWRGVPFTAPELAGFDLAKVVGAPAYVQVMHETKGDKTYTNIANVLKLPKELRVKSPLEPILFSVDQLDSTEDLKECGLPEWIEKLVVNSREWERLVKRAPGTPEEPEEASETSTEEDDIPF